MAAKRVSSLDGLRGVAILSVVLFHYFTRWTHQQDQQIYPYGDSMEWLGWFGYAGVYLFFIISGFVIYRSLATSRGLLHFAIKRADRLVLPMVVLSIITFAVMASPLAPPVFAGRLADFLPSWSFTSPSFWRWVDPMVGYIDGSYWTLYVEVRFYILAALIWFFGTRRLAGLILTSLACVAVLAFAALSAEPVGPAKTIVSILLFPQYISLFAAGAVYAQIEHGRLSKAQLVQIALLIPLSVVGLYLAGDERGTTIEMLIPLTVMAHAAVLITALEWPIVRLWSWWPLTGIGLISYSLYLIHQRVGVTIIHQMPTDWPLALQVIGAFAVTCLMVGIAYLSWRFIERSKPISRLVAVVSRKPDTSL